MSSHASETQAKPTKYYVDFENVHGAGLKGVDALTENDEVIIIYSQAAETFHIEHAIDILKSKARIQFLEADAGTRNAADFQLIVALYADMDDAYDYAIVSGDGGFDAAIKMGERMGKPQVRRLGNIAGDEAEPEKPKSRRSRRSRSGRDTAKSPAETVEPAEAEAPAQDETTASIDESLAAEAEAAPSTVDETAEHGKDQVSEQASEHKSSSSRRRPRRRKRNGGSAEAEEQPAAQAQDETSQTQNASTRKETDDAYARAAEAMRLASESSSTHSGGATAEKAQSKPAVETPSDSGASANENAAALVKELLEQKGVQLSDAQIATVTSALYGPDGRQGFYRRIIKIERQQKGRALYHQVREHYQALLDTVSK